MWYTDKKQIVVTSTLFENIDISKAILKNIDIDRTFLNISMSKKTFFVKNLFFSRFFVVDEWVLDLAGPRWSPSKEADEPRVEKWTCLYKMSKTDRRKCKLCRISEIVQNHYVQIQAAVQPNDRNNFHPKLLKRRCSLWSEVKSKREELPTDLGCRSLPRLRCQGSVRLKILQTLLAPQ